MISPNPRLPTVSLVCLIFFKLWTDTLAFKLASFSNRTRGTCFSHFSRQRCCGVLKLDFGGTYVVILVLISFEKMRVVKGVEMIWELQGYCTV